MSAPNRSADTPVDSELPEPVEAADDRASSMAEWISMTIASMVLISVIAAVIYLWSSDRQQQPPTLQVIYSEVRQSQGQFYVPFEVKNTGGETAESIQVVAELRVNDGTVQTGEQTLDFLSGQERAEGAFVFTQDPRRGDLMIRVASYQTP